MPANFAPGMLPAFRPYLDDGFARAGNGKSLDTFAIWAHVDVNVADDVHEAMRPFKEYVITWSQRQQKFMEAHGFAGLAERLRELLFPDEEGIEPTAFRGAGAGAAEDGSPVGGGARRGPRRVHRRRQLAGGTHRADPSARATVVRLRITGLIVRYGHQFTHERMVENLEVFRVIAEAAGKTPRTI